MGKVSNWNPQRYDGQFMAASMDRLEAAAEIIAELARKKVPVGTITRKIGKSGKYWTERTPGSLRRSIRVVKLHDSKARNVRVYAGNSKVYYARMVEFGTAKKAARPFLRPALNANKSKIRSILENGA